MPENRPTAVSDPVRSAFGDDWRRFVETLDHAHIQEAEASLQALLGRSRLDGLTLLEIGSGNCRFSLAARGLGATVHSVDRDPELDRLWRGIAPAVFPRRPALDHRTRLDPRCALCRRPRSLRCGIFLGRTAPHRGVGRSDTQRRHVGQTGRAIGFRDPSARPCCAGPGRASSAGTLRPIRRRNGAHAESYIRLLWLAFKATRRDFQSHVTQYRSKRGLDFEHDLHDWMRGYPCELIHPKAVASEDGKASASSRSAPTTRGLQRRASSASDCDEYVYRRR